MSTLTSSLKLSSDQVDFEPEVELISLTTETLPHYKLRADYSIRFSGYHHSDFNRAEQVKEDVKELTNDQIHRTLEYFILCGLRVNKMTETYEDCAALTMLVQEQRSHLDLAANIGLNLVEKNTQLEQRVVCLEEQLEASKETMKQMRHQLTLKDNLLRMFHSEIEDSEDSNNLQSEFICMERLSEILPKHNLPSDNVFSLDKVNVKQLETKLTKLEEENLKLRDQQYNINTHTDLLESKETQLVNDCVNHILESTKTIDRLSIELNKKTNDYLNQHEEISRLLTSKIDLENKTHNLLSENDNLITLLRDHQTKEFTLTKELSDMKDRYDECINLLNEKQDEIRLLKKISQREIMKQTQHYYSSSPEPDICPNLAMELDESRKRGAEELDHSKTLRIMDQARAVNSNWLEGDDETSSGFTEDMCSSMVNVETEVLSAEQFSGNFLLRRSIQDDCERRRLLRRSSSPYHSGSVTPRGNTNVTDSLLISEALYHRERNSSGLNSLNANTVNRNNFPVLSQSMLKFPDKLQLIKPLEGSHTLRAWQNLATPSLTKTLFEDQPHGVCFRGQQLTITSTESSPNSDLSQEQTIRHLRLLSDSEDIDYEEPAPTVRAKDPESHYITHTYSNSKISNQENPSSTNRELSKHEKKIFSSYNINEKNYFLQRRLSSDSSDTRENTPVNETFTDAHLSSYSHSQPSSWLDRFTVGSIMTSIIGYTRPICSTNFITSSPYKPSFDSSRTISNSNLLSETSLIGRITNLPPLAKRKPPQQVQSGLNLLTSLAPPTSMKAAIFRDGTVDEDSPKESLTQVD